ncbi:MAG: DNA polymerase III subunit delta [Anaerolineales bacterium]|nr:MAG: DNA polymerase III subunit delta [Anaerolineales bacterium]
MTKPPPRVYLLVGDDRFAITEFVTTLRSKIGDATVADMNTQQFSGDHLDRGAFEEACMSVPFLSSRRIVVLDNAQDVLKLKDSREFLIALLDRLPDSTALVIIENVQAKGSKSKRKPSALVSWVDENPDFGKIWQFRSPHGAQFISWVQERCHSLGGAMSVDAARLLAESVMDDPYMAHQEIVKLLDYVNYERPVEVTDVEKLTPFRGQTNIFAMVDAVGERRMSDANRHLHSVLAEEDSFYVFAMIIRQFRLLLQAQSALEEGKEISSVLNLPKFVAQKITSQARAFSASELERIYHELLSIDISVKNSTINLDAALEGFIAATSNQA